MLLIKLSIASLLKLSEKTYISFKGSIGKKAKKFRVASSLVYLSSPEILLLAFAWDSRVIYKGSYSKLTNSAFKRENKCRAKRVIPRLNRVTRLARVKRGYLKFKQATRAINVRAIKSNLILKGYNRVSLYKAKVYIVL